MTDLPDTSPNLGLPFYQTKLNEFEVQHNEALLTLDALVMLAVKDRDLSAPPSTPALGDRYLVKPIGTGGFAGQDNRIAQYDTGGWNFYAPQSGWTCYVQDEQTLIAWDGTAWQPALDVLGVTAIQNLSLLGIGTTADATNPLSAKLNNALFAARTVAEGGDGMLRYKLSKEDAAKTLSFLFQNNFSGRAEIGLTGDDDFHFKVSPDGSTWHEAMVIDRSSGNVSIGTTLDVNGSLRTTTVLQFKENDGTFDNALFYDNSFATNDLYIGRDSDNLYFRTAGNVAAAIDSSGHLGIGTASPTDMLTVAGHAVPSADNAYTCGKSGQRWSAVWAANGSIQTSDAREKVGVVPCGLGLDFINALRPVSYQFKVGSNVPAITTGTYTELEPATEQATESYVDVEIVNGVAVQTTKTRTVQRPLVDVLPLVDADGKPVLDQHGTRRTHPVPRMVPIQKTRKVVAYMPKAGSRHHYGLIAQEVKQALGTTDFGGWIQTDPDNADSEQGLRYDEFIAPIIKAVQELAAEFDAYKATHP